MEMDTWCVWCVWSVEFPQSHEKDSGDVTIKELCLEKEIPKTSHPLDKTW